MSNVFCELHRNDALVPKVESDRAYVQLRINQYHLFTVSANVVNVSVFVSYKVGEEFLCLADMASVCYAYYPSSEDFCHACYFSSSPGKCKERGISALDE